MKNSIVVVSLLLPLLLACNHTGCLAAESEGSAKKLPAKPLAATATAAHADAADDDADEDADKEDLEPQEGEATVGEQLKELKLQVQKLRKETEARKRLEVSEEEKEQKAVDILSAAGREYTMLKKGALSLEYNLSYAYVSGDVIKDASTIEKRSSHNITNLIYTEYALKDNLSANVSLPFAYKYNKTGTDQAQEGTDMGDVSVGLQLQPAKAGGTMPPVIFSAGLTMPTGSSPGSLRGCWPRAPSCC